MRFTIIDAEQRSDLWRAARAGKLTGSRAADMLAKIKTGEAAARRDLRLQLACERVTGQPQDDDYINKEMQRGIDLEPVAIGEYEALTGLLVQRTGFLLMNGVMAGCSLDGHVNDFEGITEIKCPKSATHLRYIKGGCVPSDHIPQLRHNLWVSGAQWADFVSFDDRFPVELQLFRVRVYAKDLDIPSYASEAGRFLAEVSVDVNEISALKVAA